MPGISREPVLHVEHTPTIEEWVASKDPYRVAAHGLPMTYPYVSTGSKERGPSEIHRIFDNKIRTSLREILGRHGIHAMHDARLDYRYPRYNESSGRYILNVNCKDADPNPASWHRAAKEIWSFFWDNGADKVVDKLQVEVMNPWLSYNDFSRLLPKDEPIILETLAGVRQKVLEAVVSLIPDIWTSIAYHLRVNEFRLFTLGETEHKPTIIVFCKPGSSFKFSLLEEQILNLLKDTPTNVHLKILPGVISHAIEESRYSTPVANPYGGCSISSEGKTDHVGTLGGWLTLNLPNSVQKKCALTCYQAVRSPNERVAEWTDTKGFTLNDPRGQVNVVYPAAFDLTNAMNFYRPPAFKEIFMTLQSRPPIGKVILASGSRVKQGQELDWALIETPETFTQNPRPTFYNQAKTRSELIEFAKEGQTVQQIGTIKPGDWVAKVGRTTGLSSSEVNSLLRDINWPAIGQVTSELEVIGSRRKVMACPGDEGSLMINVQGEIVGILFAVDFCCTLFNICFVTPLETIQEDVNKLTGGGYLTLA